jgi:hypothetical protein
MKEEYFIWSIEHTAWWRPKKSGYTSSWSCAGRYTKEEAFKISARANWSALSEVPVPISFFEFQVECHKKIEEMQVK